MQEQTQAPTTPVEPTTPEAQPTTTTEPPKVEPEATKPQPDGLERKLKALEEINARLARKAEAAEERVAKAELERQAALDAASEATATSALTGLGVDPEIAQLIAPRLKGAADLSAEAKRLAAKLVRPMQVHSAPSSTTQSAPSDPRAAFEAALKRWR